LESVNQHDPNHHKEIDKPSLLTVPSPGVDSNSYVHTSTSNETPDVVQGHLVSVDQYLLDVQNLSANKLAKKYKLTYSSWRGMKQRCKRYGYPLDQKFVEFRSFLLIVGPRTNKDFTIDRIDNPKGYVVGNVRWASKKVQGLNKGNVVFLTHKGETLPLTVWAAKTKQKVDTLYKRKQNGWTNEEIIEGKQKVTISTPKPIWADTPWPKGAESVFEEHYQRIARPEESRLAFYLRVSEAQAKHYEEMFEASYPNPPSAKVLAMVQKWRTNVQDAKDKCERRFKLQSLLDRAPDWRSRAREKKLWEALHGRCPAYLDD
jgi:hypothetical protein